MEPRTNAVTNSAREEEEYSWNGAAVRVDWTSLESLTLPRHCVLAADKMTGKGPVEFFRIG